MRAQPHMSDNQNLLLKWSTQNHARNYQKAAATIYLWLGLSLTKLHLPEFSARGSHPHRPPPLRPLRPLHSAPAAPRAPAPAGAAASPPAKWAPGPRACRRRDSLTSRGLRRAARLLLFGAVGLKLESKTSGLHKL